jgi:hypothetical protein
LCKARIFIASPVDQELHTEIGMILLITPSARGSECASALEVAAAQSVHYAPSLQEAALRLRSQEYDAVVLDQPLLDADTEQGEIVLQHVGTAIPIYVNCAISGKERIVREVLAALRRWKHVKDIARKAAQQGLLAQLREPLTAMLLECELLLSVPNTASTQDKIRTLERLAREIAERLEITELALSRTLIEASSPPY